jgi:hypothetical protein
MNRLLLSAAVTVAVAGSASAACCRSSCRPAVPEDPAVVAARAEAKKRDEFILAVGFGVTVAVGGTIYLANFVRETKQALDSTPTDRWNSLDVDLR